MFLRITAGDLKGRRIRVVDTAIRPTEEKVRAALFNTLFSLRYLDGTLFYDMFAGSGAVGIEALSRGAAHVLFTERDRRRAHHLEEQIALLDLSNRAQVVCADAFSAKIAVLLPHPADIIFIDPPYVERERLVPLVTRAINEGIIASNGIVIVESDIPLPEMIAGWGRKEKRYGDTRLSFFSKE